MNFGASNWLWALAFVPLLVLLYARAERRSAIKLREFVSPRLLPQLAGNVDRVRRAIRFAFVLFALALAIIALAKPRWGYTYEDVKRRGLDLLFAVDTSRSMLSNDVAPNRLERVKLAAQDLITELQGDRAGLIAFAGRAFLRPRLNRSTTWIQKQFRKAAPTSAKRSRWRHKHLGKARWETAL